MQGVNRGKPPPIGEIRAHSVKFVKEVTLFPYFVKRVTCGHKLMVDQPRHAVLAKQDPFAELALSSELTEDQSLHHTSRFAAPAISIQSARVVQSRDGAGLFQHGIERPIEFAARRGEP